MAFANTAGGVLVVGVEDGTRRVIGIPDVLAAEERLSKMVVDSILPRLVPDIEIALWRKTHVLVVQVHPSAARPHYLARLGPDAGALVRVIGRVFHEPGLIEQWGSGIQRTTAACQERQPQSSTRPLPPGRSSEAYCRF